MSDSRTTAVRGRVLVVIYSADKSFISEAVKRFRESCGITETIAEVPGVKVFLTSCLHTIEEEIYPLLKDIYSARTSDEILIAAVACFFRHNYTERIVLYGETDLFEYAPIRKITGAEREEAEKAAFRFRRKCMNRFNESMSKKAEEKEAERRNRRQFSVLQDYEEAMDEYLSRTSSEASELQTKDDFLNATFEQFSAYLFGRITFFVNQPYEECSESAGYSFFWGRPNPEGREYIKADEGTVFYLEGVQPEKSLPLYPSFEQFLFWPNDAVQKFLKFSGWCIRFDDKVHVFTNPFETAEDEFIRAMRDMGLKVCFEEHLPLLAGELRDFEFRHPEAEEKFKDALTRHGREGFSLVFSFEPTLSKLKKDEEMKLHNTAGN